MLKSIKNVSVKLIKLDYTSVKKPLIDSFENKKPHILNVCGFYDIISINELGIYVYSANDNYETYFMT